MSKRKQQFVKICALQSDKTTCRTFMACLWICAGSAGIRIAALFAKCAIFRRTRRIFKDCGTLQDGALRRGHQSAAHRVGEKRHTCAAFSSATAACLLRFFTYIIAMFKTFFFNIRIYPCTYVLRSVFKQYNYMYMCILQARNIYF